MTNDPYGNYQTPSSRPPEPPYRTDAQSSPSAGAAATQAQRMGAASGQTANQPDFRGFDTLANTTQMRSVEAYEPSAYSQGAEAATAQAASRQPQARQSGAAGKSFLFGFLGALVACAIALGGFYMLNGNNGNAANTATTVVGSSDPTVINAVEEGQSVSEAVAAKALPSVVAVYNYQNVSSGYGYGFGGMGGEQSLQAAGMGSGVVISDDGYILTNYHVVEGAEKVTIKVADSERDATYVGGDASSDIAVVKVDDTSGLEAADIGDSDSLVIGEWVMTVGAPLGLEQSVATGVVSATNRSTIMSDEQNDMYSYYYGYTNPTYTYYPNMIQTDAVINPGNSGGALVDSNGKLIGINTMISSYSGDYAGVGFAIPVNYAISIANDIIEGKEPTHAMLGVSISSVTASNAKRYGLSASEGAYIASISEGTGAAESDLQVGDIIVQVDDAKITSTTDVTLEVREHNPGDTITVKVNRNGEEIEIPVVLSSDENQVNVQDNGGQQQGYGYGYGNGYGQGYGEDQMNDLFNLFGL